MPNAWKRERTFPLLLSLRGILLLFFLSLIVLIFLFLRSGSSQSPNTSSLHLQIQALTLPSGISLHPFDCNASPQASPVFAARVEGLRYPFLYSLADFGSLPEKPHKNIVRMLKGKPFRRPDISSTIQEFLQGSKPADGIVIDVGANVGMAAFAAAAMGFRVLAFEPVFENLQRICDGVFLNRFWDRMVIFEAAASDRIGNITFHKVKDLKLFQLESEFEKFLMDADEDVDSMYTRFTKIVNASKVLGTTLSNGDLVRKICDHSLQNSTQM